MSRHSSDYRFFYVRSEPTAAQLKAFAAVEHKPHKKVPKGFPVACVAYQIEPQGSVVFAYATHNPVDTYDREDARSRALYKLINPLGNPKLRDDLGIVPYEEEGLKVKAHIMEQLKEKKAPVRVQKAARYWLHLQTVWNGLDPKPSKVDAPPRLKVTIPKPQLVAARRRIKAHLTRKK